jgi:metallo-beta-lactamase family protein
MTVAQATIEFLGAAGTVTGSMHLVRAGGRRVLLDCGLFQGQKDLRVRNWAERVPDPRALDAIVLSHAHIDHSGYLPLVVRQGFRGPVYCTEATGDLLEVVLPDAAHLQEEEAERANRRGYTKHHPALPLYTAADADAALRQIVRHGYESPFPVAGDVTATLRPAGHILGSATVELGVGGANPTRLVYSGDLGRYDRAILRDPAPVREADVLLLESTYGDRTHATGADAELTALVREVARRGSALLVPAFAVDRTQELLWMLRRLELAGTIPVLPVYCDSPMAIEVNEIYRRHPDECDPPVAAAFARGENPLHPDDLHLARTPEESRGINEVRGPVIIISSSGMATGGRILHHLALRLGDPDTTVLLVGYQAPGTRGRALEDGADQIRIFGVETKVRARIAQITALSAHADRDETLRWLSGFERPPRVTYLVHGEAGAASALARAIEARYRWRVEVPRDGQKVELAA